MISTICRVRMEFFDVNIIVTQSEAGGKYFPAPGRGRPWRRESVRLELTNTPNPTVHDPEKPSAIGE